MKSVQNDHQEQRSVNLLVLEIHFCGKYHFRGCLCYFRLIVWERKAFYGWSNPGLILLWRKCLYSNVTSSFYRILDSVWEKKGRLTVPGRVSSIILVSSSSLPLHKHSWFFHPSFHCGFLAYLIGIAGRTYAHRYLAVKCLGKEGAGYGW